MKFAAAAVLPVLVSVASAGPAEKRALSCQTIFGLGKAVKNLPTNTRVRNAGRTIVKTVLSKSTVVVTPTVSRTLTGTIVITDSITTTTTKPPTTIYSTGSSTSTVSAQAGFTAAANALPTTNSNAAHKKVVIKHPKRDAEAAPTAAPGAKVAAGAKVAISVDCVRDLAGGAVTVTKTVVRKPYVTQYKEAKTITIDRQKTRHTEKVVATVTTQKRTVVEVARATHWAACEADNLLGFTLGKGNAGAGAGISLNVTGSIGGNSTQSPIHVGISSVVLVSGTVAAKFDAATAQQCCIRCQTTPGCVGSQWRSGVCTTHVRPASFAACSANQKPFTVGSFFANPLSILGIGEGYILSNGRCGGIWSFGGLSL